MPTFRTISPNDFELMKSISSSRLQPYLEALNELGEAQIGVVDLHDEDDRNKVRNSLHQAAQKLGKRLEFIRVRSGPGAVSDSLYFRWAKPKAEPEFTNGNANWRESQ